MTYREHHCIAQYLYEVLVQEAHVPSAKETQFLWAILLNSNELLHGPHRIAEWHIQHLVQETHTLQFRYEKEGYGALHCVQVLEKAADSTAK